MNRLNRHSAVSRKTWVGLLMYGLLWLSGAFFSKSDWMFYGLPLWFVLAGLVAPLWLMLYVMVMFRGRHD